MVFYFLSQFFRCFRTFACFFTISPGTRRVLSRLPLLNTPEKPDMVLSSVFSRNGCFSPFAISPGTRKGPSRSPLFYFFRNIDRWDPSGSHTRRCSVLLRLTELHPDCLLCFTDLCVCFTFTPGGPCGPPPCASPPTGSRLSGHAACTDTGKKIPGFQIGSRVLSAPYGGRSQIGAERSSVYFFHPQF